MTDAVDNSFAARELSLFSAEAQDAFALAAINSGPSLNPVQAYLIGLSSAASRQTMKSFLNIVAGMLGFTSCWKCCM